MTQPRSGTLKKERYAETRAPRFTPWIDAAASIPTTSSKALDGSGTF
jgi:hypothetical protein